MRKLLARARNAGRLLRNRLSPGAVVLLFHRVADLDADPQQLAVREQHFREQMDVVRRFGTLVRLADLREEITRRRSGRGLVALTFDDGYADNKTTAKPVLESFGIPATIFVSSGYCGAGREFWWDELERIFLSPGTLPDRLQMTWNGEEIVRPIEPSNYSPSDARRHAFWTVENRSDPTARHAVYRELATRLRRAPVATRESVLDTLRSWSGSETARDTHRPMTPDQVRALSSDLISVGAHTVLHPTLSALSAEDQEREIRQSKADVERFTSSEVDLFAYPFGGADDYAPVSVALARTSGFSLACTTDHDTVRRGTDPFRVPRINVRDWSGTEFESRIGPLLGSR